jgi:hypothetical protein
MEASAELLGLRLMVMTLIAREAMGHTDPHKVLATLRADTLRLVEEITFSDPRAEPIRPVCEAYVKMVFGSIVVEKTN